MTNADAVYAYAMNDKPKCCNSQQLHGMNRFLANKQAAKIDGSRGINEDSNQVGAQGYHAVRLIRKVLALAKPGCQVCHKVPLKRSVDEKHTY